MERVTYVDINSSYILEIIYSTKKVVMHKMNAYFMLIMSPHYSYRVACTILPNYLLVN